MASEVFSALTFKESVQEILHQQEGRKEGSVTTHRAARGPVRVIV